MRVVTLFPVLFAAAAFLFSSAVFAQEALKSAEEEYYDFLSLRGMAERPTLAYRTLSDSEWTLTGEAAEGGHVWAEHNLGSRFLLWEAGDPADNWFARGIDQSLTMKVYGPEWFNSFNTHAPYGQNDGALWQGKGYNTSLTAGIRFESYGFEATLKPQLSFSQNMDFGLLPSGYDSKYAYFWGYGNNRGIDTPQRFGDDAFWTFDWGDSEIRWSWHSFTVGFGTQAIWLGPAYMSPILHSNNAGGYPKFDIGLRKTEVTIPKLGWYIGDIEARLWTGRLTESDYFDNDDSNDHTMVHGLSVSYAPSFIPGLTLSANRICTVKWDWKNLKHIIPMNENTYVGDESGNGEDQKISLAASWMFPQVGFELYGEIGRDDFTSSVKANLLHTLVYTVGLKKAFTFSKKHDIHGEVILEVSNFEMGQDFQYQWAWSFYNHYQVTQGYTNRGQILGNAWSPGGNSQFLGLNVYYPQGNTLVFVRRTNPDNNFIHKDSIRTDESMYDEPNKDQQYRTYIAYGVSSNYFVTKDLSVFGSAQFIDVENSYYYLDVKGEDPFSWMFHFELGCKFNF